MLRQEKEAEVTALRDRFGKSEAAILLEYRGIKALDMAGLRRRMGSGGVSLQVVKNRLARLAIQGTEFESLSQFFTGPVLLATVERDPVVSAKLLKDFMKSSEVVKVKSGFLRPGRVLSPKEVEALADVPSKEASIARLMGSMQAPIRNMTCLLAAIPRQLLNVLVAVEDKKRQAA